MMFRAENGVRLVVYDAMEASFNRMQALEDFRAATGAGYVESNLVITTLVAAQQRWYCWIP